MNAPQPSMSKSALARKIGQLKLGHLTVRQALDQMDEALRAANGAGGAANMRRNTALRVQLEEVGIHATAADGYDDLDALYYGQVFDSKRFLKAYPELAPYAAEFRRLTF